MMEEYEAREVVEWLRKSDGIPTAWGVRAEHDKDHDEWRVVIQ